MRYVLPSPIDQLRLCVWDPSGPSTSTEVLSPYFQEDPLHDSCSYLGICLIPSSRKSYINWMQEWNRKETYLCKLWETWLEGSAIVILMIYWLRALAGNCAVSSLRQRKHKVVWDLEIRPKLLERVEWLDSTPLHHVESQDKMNIRFWGLGNDWPNRGIRMKTAHQRHSDHERKS